MSVILNEAKQAEYIITSGEIGNKPSATLFLLGKYFRQKQKLGRIETEEKLDAFMSKNYKGYNPALWENAIEEISKKALKYPLREIEHVGITQHELDVIAGVKNIKYEKLLFVILCHAKLYNLISENNNSWVNTDIPEIYRLARVTVKHREDKFLFLNDLEKKGFISFSAKNDNLNLKCNFIDTLGEEIFRVYDFRELGYEYLNHLGIERFCRCSNCHRIIRAGKTKQPKYCVECAKTVDREKAKLRMSNIRK